ncbi:putative MFS multidrug transporter [Talaromyces proteolyticus]|uniref:MFS multidrug transporter n=1 Tax=Talaromyces proteolyticus TaxID=1131652 RepID=A0AAD4L4Q6_9EURO|nr:putative MFS multidrug transporter [Talaromyces proteolyticus]KAH8705863.1 putative MFS multidrug transporter [Talaromyces proteolyticus]
MDNYITGIKLALVMLSVTLVAFLVLLDMAIIATAIPRITSQFHSLQDVGWYGSAYQLASASLQPLAGKLYSQFRSKWIFLAFFFIFELGSLVCGVATSSKMLIIGRALAGIGSAGLVNGGLTILSACLPLHKRPAYIGALLGISQLGVVCGPLLGGAFTQYANWRWCFYVNLPAGAIVAVLLLFIHIPDNIRPREISVLQTIQTKLDLVGFGFFASASIQFFLALEYGGNQYAWNSATVIGLFGGAAGVFIVYLVWEYFKGDEAMIPYSMVKQRAVWSSCLVQLFFWGALQLNTYYLPIYFQAIKGASPMMSGVYMLPIVISQLIGAALSGPAVSKLGFYLPWSVGSAILMSIGNGLFCTISPSTSTQEWIGYEILVGAGRGLGMQMPVIAIQNTLSPDAVSISMSLLSFSQTFGGAVFLTFGDTVFTNSLSTTVPTYAPGVNPEVVIAAGGTGLREVISNPELLYGVLVAYGKTIDRVFYLAAGCACATFLTTWGMGWKDIRKKQDTTPNAKAEKV